MMSLLLPEDATRGERVMLIIVFILLSLSVISLLSSCKVRQVSKVAVHSQIDSSRTIHKDSSGNKQQLHIDTSTKQVLTHHSSTDSTSTSSDIIPDSGATIKILPDGTIIGKIASIHSVTKKHVNKTTDTKSLSHSGVSDSSNQSSHTALADSGRKISIKDSTSKQTHSDSTVAANFPIKWVLIGLVVLLIIGGLFWKFRKLFGL